MKRVRIAKYAYIFTSAALVLVGCVLFFFPEISLHMIVRTAGVIILISGIAKLFGYFSDDLTRIAFQFDFALGIITSFLGLVILLSPSFFSAYLTVCVSILAIIDALITVQNSIEARSFGIEKWGILLLAGLAAAFVGIITLVNPFKISLVAVQLSGIALAFDGAQNMVVGAFTIHHKKKAEKR